MSLKSDQSLPCVATAEKLNKGSQLYFIGIGGSGMYGLACLALDLGFYVSGTDARENENVKRLREKGIRVCTEEKVLPKEVDIVVFSLAVFSSHPLLEQARAREIPVWSRPCMQGHLMRSFPIRIAIAGAHGKSSTVGMCAEILCEGGYRPTVLAGADLSKKEGGYRKGGGEILLAEACEYRDAFLSFSPTHAAVLNTEWEHIDYFKTHEQLLSSYQAFLDLPCVENRFAGAAALVRCDHRFGCEEGMHARYAKERFGRWQFDLFAADAFCGRISLAVIGKHQVENAVAAAAICASLGVPSDVICRALSSYTGVGGRMEYCGRLGRSRVYLDYAHHPTEIEAALLAASAFGTHVACVLEPHTYSRIFAFEKRITALLKTVEFAGILPIFAARETDTLGISSESLALSCGGNALKDFLSARKFLIEKSDFADVILLLGAGNIGNLISYLPLVKE